MSDFLRKSNTFYDGFFKEVMSPEIHPGRLERFLSCLLNVEHVKILRVIPNDSSRIADESSLVIMDIVVELDDGQIVNVEIQKHGYKFPGQRSACYSADLLLRQYKRVRDEKGKYFNYGDIKTVYTIAIFENSTESFKKHSDIYVHTSQQKTDTGLEINLLQEYIFIPLDIFKKKIYAKGIENELDAWLAFIACDDPEIVLKLITEYPEFKGMYEDAYYICQNVEKVMNMFSEELRILDRNTVHLMIDELQMEVDDLNETVNEKNEIIKKSITLFIKKAAQSGDTKQSITEQLCEVYGITNKQAEEYISNIA